MPTHDAASLGWINTYTGKQFYPLEPDANLFDMRDQIHALSNLARHNGHTRKFYSVAEHATILSHLVEAVLPQRLLLSSEAVTDAALWALVHDNHEAYIGDIVRPLKRLPAFAFLGDLESRYGRLLREWLDIKISDEALAIVSTLDVEMVVYEARALFGDAINDAWVLPERSLEPRRQRIVTSTIYGLSPDAAKLAYHTRLLSLSHLRLK